MKERHFVIGSLCVFVGDTLVFMSPPVLGTVEAATSFKDITRRIEKGSVGIVLGMYSTPNGLGGPLVWFVHVLTHRGVAWAVTGAVEYYA